MKNICCFAGHGKLSYGNDVKEQIFAKCRELVLNFYVNEFWVGNYGSFDRLAAAIVRSLKQQYSNIELNLVIPYLTNDIITYKEQYYSDYDNILMAQISVDTPKRYQILKCNQYMVDESKYLISFVNCSFGGAAETLKYAKRKNHIKIFNFGE